MFNGLYNYGEIKTKQNEKVIELCHRSLLLVRNWLENISCEMPNFDVEYLVVAYLEALLWRLLFVLTYLKNA